jgi:hypothetical protein
MGTVVIGVECRAAGAAKCYARELVQIAEAACVPFTWLISVTAKDPMSNVRLYHEEYLHRIPAWHEVGVWLDVSGDASDEDGPQRSHLPRVGKEMLKQCHVKPVCCVWSGARITGADVRSLVDCGMLAAAGEVVGREANSMLPYHPAYDDVWTVGDTSLWLLPQTGIGVGEAWEERLRVLASGNGEGGALLVTIRDDRDDTADLARVIEASTQYGVRTRTLTPALVG